MACCLAPPYRSLPLFRVGLRFYRHHVTPSSVQQTTYTMDQPRVASRWPLPRWQGPAPRSSLDRRRLMHHIEQLEIERLNAVQPFQMPTIKLGDLVEVRYELSRSQQTQAVFQGYCVEIRSQGLASAFVLKNSYDGIGVTQLVPRYSPRLLGVRVIRSVVGEISANPGKPETKDYRYRWHLNARHKYQKSRRQIISTLHRPGIRSLEPRLQHRLRRIMRRYMIQRAAAGLPPYMPVVRKYLYDQTRRLEVRAEINRRIMVYAAHEEARLRSRERAKRYKTRWGVYKINKTPPAPALTELSSRHLLAANNLPV